MLKKKKYFSPKLESFGSVSELTKAGQTMAGADFAFDGSVTPGGSPPGGAIPGNPPGGPN